MTHESNNCACSLALVKVVESLCNSVYIGNSLLKQRNAQFKLYSGKIAVVKVCVGVVCKVLDVVDYAGVLLSRDNLKALDYNLVILYTVLSECCEPERWSVEVTWSNVLAGSCTVDADC